MIVPDANLLIYAYNRLDTRHHDQARSWWESLLNSPDPVGLPWISAGGFLRVMTHPRILDDPMPVPEAVAAVRSWLERPNVIVLQPGSRFGELFLTLLEQSGTGGNLTTDAQLAALAIEHQAELHSNDADFGRFPGLRWRNPLA